MDASVIIPTCNRADQLSRTLKSLAALEYDPKAFELIVVDNGSTDNTKIVVDDFTKTYTGHIIRYFYDDIPGLLTGRHRGAKEARSELLVFIDDDIHVDKGWLNAITDTFRKNPDVHLVGGKCLPDYEQEPPHWLNYFWNYFPGGDKMLVDLSLCDYGEIEKEVLPTWIWGLNFSIRKSSLYELGGFHPDSIPARYQHFQGDGETGLSNKMIKKGYKAIYNPKALVFHEVPANRMTLAYFEKRYFYQGVCNSYTEIRSNGGLNDTIINRIILKNIKPFVGRFVRKFRGSNSNIENKLSKSEKLEKEMLTMRFKAMLLAGFQFHRNAVKKHPDLLQWILKENYFDYKLPDLP